MNDLNAGHLTVKHIGNFEEVEETSSLSPADKVFELFKQEKAILEGEIREQERYLFEMEKSLSFGQGKLNEMNNQLKIFNLILQKADGG
jgi:hypothetical protein